MKIFATLPADVRKALARKEMRQRGLSQPRQSGEWRDLLPHYSTEDLERMEALCAQWGGVPLDAAPPEVKTELAALLSNTVRALRVADVPGRERTDAELLALAHRLEQKLVPTARAPSSGR